jgi:hypothetical protein
MRKVLLLLLCLSAAMATAQTEYHEFDPLTAASSTPAYGVNYGPNRHTVELAVTGSPSACTASLQGTLKQSDKVVDADFKDLSSDQDCTTVFMFHVINRAVKTVRVKLKTLTGGTSPTVTPTYFGER